MKVNVGMNRAKSSTTGAIVWRFTLVAESPTYAYYAILSEGAAPTSCVIPCSESPAVKRLEKKLYDLALKYQDAFDKVFLAPDWSDFKAGRPAPIAADLYWQARKAVEAESIK